MWGGRFETALDFGDERSGMKTGMACDGCFSLNYTSPNPPLSSFFFGRNEPSARWNKGGRNPSERTIDYVTSYNASTSLKNALVLTVQNALFTEAWIKPKRRI